MAIGKLYNRAGHACATTGTGTVTLGAALGSVSINQCTFQTFATAGAANLDVVSYLILDSNGAWEYGTGTYTSSGTTLSRTLGASSTGSLLSLSGTSQVFISARAEDLTNYGFRANKNATDQTSITHDVQTKITFTTEVFDIGGYYDATNSKWTPPAGRVLLTSTLYWTTNVVIGDGSAVYIYKNGSAMSQDLLYAAKTASVQVKSVVIDDANGTDYYEVYGLVSGIGPYTVNGTVSLSYFAGTIL